MLSKCDDHDLISVEVDLERINDNGQGCLHKAAQRRNRAVCEWLLEVAQLKRQEHFTPNKAEKSVPSDLAKYAGDAELAALLERWQEKMQPGAS